MPVSTPDYVPLLVSERLSRNVSGSFDLCRAAVLAMLINTGSNGEWMTKPNGRDWGGKRMTKLLNAMRNATGDVARGSYNQGHVSAFERGAGWSNAPYEQANTTWVDFLEDLGTDKWVYDLAGDVRYVPSSSPLRKYVNPDVGHDIFILKLSKDGRRIAFIDPMTPHGTKNYVRWAPVNDFRVFAREFMFGPDNKIVAGRVKRGSLTHERRTRATLSTQINNQKATISTQRTIIDSKNQKIQALRDDKANLIEAGQRLDALLVECNAEEDPNEIEQLEGEVALLLDQMQRIKDIAAE